MAQYLYAVYMVLNQEDGHSQFQSNSGHGPRYPSGGVTDTRSTSQVEAFPTHPISSLSRKPSTAKSVENFDEDFDTVVTEDDVASFEGAAILRAMTTQPRSRRHSMDGGLTGEESEGTGEKERGRLSLGGEPRPVPRHRRDAPVRQSADFNFSAHSLVEPALPGSLDDLAMMGAARLPSSSLEPGGSLRPNARFLVRCSPLTLSLISRSPFFPLPRILPHSHFIFFPLSPLLPWLFPLHPAGDAYEQGSARGDAALCCRRAPPQEVFHNG